MVFGVLWIGIGSTLGCVSRGSKCVTSRVALYSSLFIIEMKAHGWDSGGLDWIPNTLNPYGRYALCFLPLSPYK